MLTETGRVVAVEDDSIWVETIRQSTCGACAARKGCGHGMLNRYASGQRGYIRVLPGDNLKPRDCTVNDQVMIALPESVILRGSAIVYLMPLLLMLLGAALGGYGAASDIASLLGAGTGLLGGLVLVRYHAHRHRDDRSLQPVMDQIVEAPTQVVEVA
ncbi:SoxR reducing system RseC family protein [Halioglobus pacificus]|uniref:Positive regulator for alginate biosynthesis MucC n=1 Tax=Parahalioglobus pacificus TaxID=930806 RepID=A0A919CIV8_9GAMM|nr:SoxR reducing system RseC family protein [Halioglobus pacificus]NQY03859.1 SoxR reducing system RseC family protein [Halieaceae bacterium]GHD28358.1 positive regulator for alginate biosynthesis MucC [Halioglobus pacificus]